MFLISMKELIVVDYQQKLGLILKYQDKLLQNVCNISSIISIASCMIKSKWINKVFFQNQTWLKCCNCNL